LKNQHLFQRMGYAINGIHMAVKSEKSLRFQFIVAILVVCGMFILKLSFIWIALIVLVIAVVIAAELFNTALERLSDHVQPNYHEQIKYVKDVAAGAVLVISMASMVIGLLMLLSLINS